ncbi:MAG: hypothetical protein AAB875_03625, partial [Patescibacteria group bacterium]
MTDEIEKARLKALYGVKYLQRTLLNVECNDCHTIEPSATFTLREQREESTIRHAYRCADCKTTRKNN